MVASFIPTFLLAYFSSSYVSNIIEKEVHSNLIKQAKSYGLFTLEKLKTLDQQLTKISDLSDNNLPTNIISDFSSLELVSANNINTAIYNKNNKAQLSYKHISNNRVWFKLETLHKDVDGKNYLLRGRFFLDSLFSDDSNNPYNEPICIFSETGKIIYCNEGHLYPKE